MPPPLTSGSLTSARHSLTSARGHLRSSSTPPPLALDAIADLCSTSHCFLCRERERRYRCSALPSRRRRRRRRSRWSSRPLQELRHSDYYCPDCEAKTTCKRPNLQKLEPKEKYAQRYVTCFGWWKTSKLLYLTRFLRCNGMEGSYIPKLHLIVCKCGSCGSKMQTPSEWERHTGCKAKEWKYSVKIKDTREPLEKWLAEYAALGSDPLKLDKQQLMDFLKGSSCIHHQNIHRKFSGIYGTIASSLK